MIFGISMNTYANGVLTNNCNKLQTALTYNGKFDTDANKLCSELQIIGKNLNGCKINYTIDILNEIAEKNCKFVAKYNDCV